MKFKKIECGLCLKFLIINNFNFIFEQEHVNAEHGDGNVIAPLILYSDKTALSQDLKVSSHPIYFSTTNIACKNRYLSEGHCLLSILPHFDAVGRNSLERLKLFQKHLTHKLQPLKDASFK